MHVLRSQLKHLLRRWRRSPGFTAVALLTLAIGVGGSTAVFSVLRGILLKPLPYPGSDRLVAIWHTAPGVGIKDLNASPSTCFTYREEGRAFQDVGIWRRDPVNVTGVAEPEQVEALDVTDGVLPILGVQPLRGRWFSRADDLPKAPETAILSYGYWQRKFGGDPAILGRMVKIDGTPRQIIGIMPAGFLFANMRPSIILPLQLDRSKVFVGQFSYQSVGRLKPGVTLAQANADVARMLPIMNTKFPPPPGMSSKIFEEARIGPNLRWLKQDAVGDVGTVLWVLMASAGMVLLIACANVANLLLVRAAGRQDELAIRAALGAGWTRIARELLGESLIIGLAGGLLGIGAAAAAMRLLVAIAPANLPRVQEISIDVPVLLFALAASLISGLLFGLIPVWKYARPHPGAALREGGRTLSEGRERHRARSILVVAQVAMALVLLVSSGLMIRSMLALKSVQPGFTKGEQILSAWISTPEADVPDKQRVLRMEYDILQKLAALPRVESAGIAGSITMDGNNDNDPIYAEGRLYSESQMPVLRRYKQISPGLLKTMGATLLAGRDFTWTDNFEMRPVAMVSENLARELWGSAAAAVGKRIRERPNGTWREVVGVATDERDDGVDRKAPTVVYWPLAVRDFWNTGERVERTVAFAIRSPRTGTPGFAEEVRRAVWSVNPGVPVFNVRTVEEIYARSMARTSFTLVMLAIAAGMALLLGLVGIYGVISYSVSQRTREIGIRIALGAPSPAVRRMFVGHGLLLAGLGVACGLALAIPLTRLMTALLFGVSPLDPVTYCAVAGVLVAATLLASYIPARKATAIAPVEALGRYQ